MLAINYKRHASFWNCESGETVWRSRDIFTFLSKRGNLSVIFCQTNYQEIFPSCCCKILLFTLVPSEAAGGPVSILPIASLVRSVHYVQGDPKNCTVFVRLITSSNIDQFSNFFTVRIRRTFVVILSLKIPPHLKCVATLLCKMKGLKTNNWKQDFCNNTF